MKRTILSILNFLLVTTIITQIAYTSLSTSITRNKIKESIKENLLTGFIYDDNGNKTEIFNTILRLTTLDEETIIKLMENSTADEIITDVVESIYDYNLTGDASYKYTPQRIINIVEDNMNKILSEINYSITEKERQEILDDEKYLFESKYKEEI